MSQPTPPTDAGEAEVNTPKRRSWLRRLLPVIVLVVIALLIFALDLDNYLSFDTLRENRETLTSFVAEHVLLAALVYIAVYTIATAISLPGGAILSISGGFLFGAWLGALYVLIGATLGATAVFLIAKTALGEPLKAKAGPWLDKMAAGFQENALSYLLVLRLVPLFPFFIVNLVPAFLGVRLGTYVLGTALGIIPGILVFTFTGAGIGSVLDAGETFSVSAVLTPQIITALVGLALLALLPVVYKAWQKRRNPTL
jgi:uncharacterized membrane protein YdjX (TVP38/TMEM64 family)